MQKFFLLILTLCLFGISQNNLAQANSDDDEINLAEIKIEIKRDGSSMGCINCTAEYSAVQLMEMGLLITKAIRALD